MRRNIKGLELGELEDILEGRGEDRFHARQIFSWIYQKGIDDFSRMSDLSGALRDFLKDNFSLSSLKPVENRESRDGTEKFLLELADGNFIEAVLIPAEARLTGCVSTQAGCKFACRFCASGLAGFKRNLTCAEIIEEVLHLEYRSRHKGLTHLVFMGTGEPLDNYDSVLKAIRIINCKFGLNIGARRITISTCGIIPGIKRLAGEGLQIELSVSLHAADDATRSRLMPVNKVYPLRSLIAACREYAGKTNRQVTFEYILIKGVNSDLESAKNLGRIMRGFDCKVNLIPANIVKECRLEPPGKPEILMFRDLLLKSGVNVTLRKPRGDDIGAACGQLRIKYAKI